MYARSAPQTDAGRMAWGLFKDTCWRARVAGLGAVVGVELDMPIEQLTEAGVGRALAQDLLGACEMGFVAAVNEKDGDDQA